MLLSDPGDKEAEDEEAVSVYAQLNNLINNKSKLSSEQVSFVFLLVLNFFTAFLLHQDRGDGRESSNTLNIFCDCFFFRAKKRALREFEGIQKVALQL